MTIKECVLVALIGIWLMWFSPARACDCTHFAYEALKRSGVKLSTVPSIVGTTDLASYYRGVASIRPNSSCDVYVHEFAHHDQYLHGKEAKQKYDADWWALERNAKAIEQRAMENAGACL